MSWINRAVDEKSAGKAGRMTWPHGGGGLVASHAPPGGVSPKPGPDPYEVRCRAVFTLPRPEWQAEKNWKRVRRGAGGAGPGTAAVRAGGVA